MKAMRRTMDPTSKGSRALAVFMAIVVAWAQVSVVPIAAVQADEGVAAAMAVTEGPPEAEGAGGEPAVTGQAGAAMPEVVDAASDGEIVAGHAVQNAAAELEPPAAWDVQSSAGEPAADVVEGDGSDRGAPGQGVQSESVAQPGQGEGQDAQDDAGDSPDQPVAGQPVDDNGQSAGTGNEAASGLGNAGDADQVTSGSGGAGDGDADRQSVGQDAGDGGQNESDPANQPVDEQGGVGDIGQAPGIEALNGTDGSSGAADQAAKDDTAVNPDGSGAAADSEQAAYPAFTGYANAGNVAVRVTAGEGVLPEGTVVQALPVYRQDVIDAVASVVEDQGRTLEDAVAVDVTLRDAQGNVIQPNDAVHVSFINAGMDTGEQVGVYRVADDASAVEEIPAAQASANMQSVVVEHFSIYVITDETPVYLATYRFIAADGVTVVSEQVVKSGDVLVNPAAPEVTGATFAGWYLGEELLAFGTPVSVSQTATYDVRARYNNVRHINFYSADTTRLMRTLEVDDNEPHDISGVRYDIDATHRVVGWTDASGATVTSIAVPEGADHVDVFAIVVSGAWIAFDSAGGTKVDHVFVQAGEGAPGIALPATTRAGYTFDGWYDESGARVSEGDKFSEPATLVAHWTPAEVSYTVNYWQQRVTDDMNAADADKTYDFVESVQTRALSGSAVGIDKVKNYPGFEYNAVNTDEETVVAGDGSTIVNVYYDRVTCRVNFYRVENTSRGVVVSLLTVHKGLYGAPLKDGDWDDTYYWYSSYNELGLSGSGCVLLTSYDFKTAGYADNRVNITTNGVVTTCNFYGNSKESGGTIYYYNEQVDGTFKLANTVTSDRPSLIVHEKYAGYDLYKSATNLSRGDPTTPAFWERQSDVSDDDTVWGGVIYIANKLQSFDLVYHNVNSEAKTESVKYTAPLASYGSYVPGNPYTDGLERTFGGWYADEACTVPFDFANTSMPHANVKVYAKWTVDQVTLTWDLNVPEGEASQDGDMGSATFDPGTRPASDFLPGGAIWDEDYTFDGWYTPDGKLFDANTRITRDTAVTGKWLFNGTFSVKYLNGDTEVALDGHSYADGSRVLVASGEGLTPPVADEPNFFGWLADDGTLVYSGASFEMTRALAGDDGVVVFTAVWGTSERATTLTYRVGDGLGADVANRLMNNEGVTLPSASDLGFEAPEGHVFSDWLTSDGRVLTAGQQVVVDDVNEGTENVLIAQWALRTDLSYTVNYLWVGSTDKVAESKTVEGVTYGATPSEAPVEAAGYTPVASEPVQFSVTDGGQTVDIYYYKNVEITANSDSFVYDGTEQTVSGFVCDTAGVQFDGERIVAGAAGTDVGEYPATFKEDPVGLTDVSERYIVTAAHSGELTVTPRSVVFKGETKAVEYNGAEQVITGIAAEGSGIADGQTYTLAYAAKGTLPNTDPGYPGAFEGQATIWAGEADVTANYAIEYAPGTLFITTSDIADNVTLTPADVVEIYDGIPYAAGTATALDKNGNTVVVEYSVDGQTWTDDPADITATDVADSKVVKIRASVPGAYEGYVYDEELLTITPRPIEVTAGSASKVYDGTPLTTDEWGITAGSFVDLSAMTGEDGDVGACAAANAPEGFSSVTVEGSQTLVGSSASTVASYEFNENTDAGNYLVTLVSGTLIVTDGTGEGDDPVDPGKVIVKTHEGGTYKLGDVVEFTITATNIYDAPKTMTIVEQDGVEITGQSVFENVEPGATVTTAARYTVRKADILAGGFTNIATVEFADGPGFPGKDDVDVEESNAHLTVSKSTTSKPAEGEVYKLGETLTYEVTVTNDGNLTVEDVQVVDELEGAILAEGETAEVGALAPGESVTRNFSYTVTQADVLAGRVSNVATATGTSPDPEKPEVPVEPGTAEDPVETPHASLFASKVASDPANGQTFKLGEQIRYTIEVVNNGNLAVTDITVMDDLTGESWTVEILAAGEKATFETSHTVNEADVAAGKVTNVATATGVDPEGNPVDTKATATVGVEPAAPAPEPEQPAKPEAPEPTQPAAPESAKPEEPAKPAIAKTGDATDLGLPARLVDLGLSAVAAGLVCLIVVPRRRND